MLVIPGGTVSTSTIATTNNSSNNKKCSHDSYSRKWLSISTENALKKII